jgi:hypothetical protein
MQVTLLRVIIDTTGYWVVKVGVLEKEISAGYLHVDLKHIRLCRRKILRRLFNEGLKKRITKVSFDNLRHRR